MTPDELEIANEKLRALTLQFSSLLGQLTPEEVELLAYTPENNH